MRLPAVRPHRDSQSPVSWISSLVHNKLILGTLGSRNYSVVIVSLTIYS